jgi:hypothetical protein
MFTVYKSRLPIVLGALLGLGACSPAATTKEPASGEAQSSNGHSKEQKANLANFDDLDYNVYSNQKWDEFPKSHAADIVVHYPDGSITRGLREHLEKLKPQFAFAPDTAIKEHPIKLADRNYTAVQGIMTGTFSKPMDLGDGKTMQPTGKKFTLPMLTVGRWENGVMKEEWLFWDNAAFMAQISAGK